MPIDLDDVMKEVSLQIQELQKPDIKLTNEISDISKEIQNIKQDVGLISEKIDDILDLLNTLTIFIEDNENIIDEDESENIDSNEGWLPEITEWEHNYNQDDEDDDC
jgi:uncharacterized coiled-coil DUF342 family protein